MKNLIFRTSVIIALLATSSCLQFNNITNLPVCLLPSSNATVNTLLEDYYFTNDSWIYSGGQFDLSSNIYFLGYQGMYTYNNGTITDIHTTSTNYYDTIFTQAGTMLVATDNGNDAELLRKPSGSSSFSVAFTFSGAPNYAAFNALHQTTDGKLFLAVSHRSGTLIYSKIYTSTDDGVSWTNVDTYAPFNPGRSRTHYFIDHPTGLLAIADSESGWLSGDWRVHIRRWNGSSWSVVDTFQESGSQTQAIGRPTVLNGELYISVMVVTGGVYKMSVYKYNSTLSSRTLVKAFTPISGSVALYGSNIVSDAYGNLYLYVFQYNTSTWEILEGAIYISQDSGTTWSVQAQVPSMASFSHRYWSYNPVLFIDSTGNLVLQQSNGNAAYSSGGEFMYKVSCSLTVL